MAETNQCRNPVLHRPRPWSTQTHHVVPQSWVRKGSREGRLVELCGMCHDLAHDLLNLLVRHNGVVPWQVERHFPVFIREIAYEAWAERPTGKVPVTLSHPPSDEGTATRSQRGT